MPVRKSFFIDYAAPAKYLSVKAANIYSANSSSLVDIAFASVLVPGGIFIPDLRISVANLPPKIDMLIGMDIIRRGDLLICNAENKTVMSFVVPPSQKSTVLS